MCRELTRALLQRDLDIRWDMPHGNLVPPVPNRANYLHWLNDLLGLSGPAGEAASLSLPVVEVGIGALVRLSLSLSIALLTSLRHRGLVSCAVADQKEVGKCQIRVCMGLRCHVTCQARVTLSCQLKKADIGKLRLIASQKGGDPRVCHP